MLFSFHNQLRYFGVLLSTTFFLIWEFRDIAGWRLRQTHFGQPLRHFGGSLSITVFSFTHILDSRSAHFGQCLTTDTKAQRNPFFHSGQPAFRHFGVLLSTMSFTFLAFLAFNFSRFQLFSLSTFLAFRHSGHHTSSFWTTVRHCNKSTFRRV